MKNRINLLPLMVFLCVTLAFGYLEANAQPTYLPVGPKTDVPVATVTGGGWTECYRDTYDNSMNANTVLAACPERRLMLSCRTTESSTLDLLAQGERSDVTFDTGNDNTGETHIANGVGWYFNTILDGDLGAAWGFVRAGDIVDKDNCDTDDSGAVLERLCWHLNAGGYRCQGNKNLNEDDSYERVVYMAGGIPTPPPSVRNVPTLSEWGLIAMAGILGIVGFMVMRRRKVTA